VLDFTNTEPVLLLSEAVNDVVQLGRDGREFFAWPESVGWRSLILYRRKRCESSETRSTTPCISAISLNIFAVDGCDEGLIQAEEALIEDVLGCEAILFYPAELAVKVWELVTTSSNWLELAMTLSASCSSSS